MIVPDATKFPGNVVVALSAFLGNIDADIKMYKRPLRVDDDIQCIGIFATEVTADETSYEMRGMGDPGFAFPTLVNYRLAIQGMITDTDEVRGVATHSALAREIRVRVATDASLRVTLGTLQTSFGGLHTERFKKLRLPRQRHLVNEVTGTWYYLSVADIEVQTETT